MMVLLSGLQLVTPDPWLSPGPLGSLGGGGPPSPLDSCSPQVASSSAVYRGSPEPAAEEVSEQLLHQFCTDTHASAGRTGRHPVTRGNKARCSGRSCGDAALGLASVGCSEGPPMKSEGGGHRVVQDWGFTLLAPLTLITVGLEPVIELK
ncbi:hypothetical protein GN956_G23450 [Arapaima gigas]